MFAATCTCAQALACHLLQQSPKMQVLLEAAIQADSVEDMAVSYPDLNKHIEDPLSLARRYPHHHRTPYAQAQAAASMYADRTMLRSDRATSGRVHLAAVHVPPHLAHQELDLARCAAAIHHKQLH